MKKLLLGFLVLFLACNATQKQSSQHQAASPAGPVEYASGITADELKDHLYTYASDEFEGRETGKPGQKKAVAYLKDTYVELGVPAAQGNNEYFQKVPLEIARMPKGEITLGDKTYVLGEDFLAFTPANESFSEIVYAGYGIEDEAYSDFGNLDVAGKVVLIKGGEPRDEEGNYILSGTAQPSAWSDGAEGMERKTQLLADRGAKAILYFDPANYARYERVYDYLAGNENGSMSLKKSDTGPSLVVLKEETALEIFPEIAESTEPQVLETAISLALESPNEEVDSENVVAIVRGSKKPNEYIIISSHLDHIGISEDGSINNGADDDGSGSVAMLEIAEAFQQAAEAGNGPERSIVFLHVTGEEKGLLGSEYYTDIAPIFPLEQTVANLNIDMIGRTDPKREGGPEYIYLIGSDKLSTELHRLSEEVNAAHTQLELDYTYNDEKDPNRFYYRSDHYNFAKNNIPIIFYFNGTHEDYHRPSDTPDKIEYDLLAKRAQLIFHTAWELANREERVAVDKVSR